MILMRILIYGAGVIGFKYNDKGELTVAYLKDEIAGFAVHFNQK